MKWQPIETAPNEVLVLLWDGYQCSVAHLVPHRGERSMSTVEELYRSMSVVEMATELLALRLVIGELLDKLGGPDPISDMAIEAALDVWFEDEDWRAWPGEFPDGYRVSMKAALTAALPFLRPASSQSDEERAREIGEHAGIDMMDDHDLFIAEMSEALAAVRAEERAKTLAECEAIARKFGSQHAGCTSDICYGRVAGSSDIADALTAALGKRREEVSEMLTMAEAIEEAERDNVDKGPNDSADVYVWTLRALIADWRKRGEALEELNGWTNDDNALEIIYNALDKGEGETYDIQAQAERPPSLEDNFSDDELAWLDLVEKTDRSSPPEYPDMALITRDELLDYLATARDATTKASKE